MKHFADKLASMSKQTTDEAIILDSKGSLVGKVFVRYTDSTIGWNNETGVIFHDNDIHLDLSKTEKHDCYNNLDGLFNLLKSIGANLFDYNNQHIVDNHKDIHARQLDSMSSVRDLEQFKISNRKYKILWV